jgi:hypothetical protein
MVKAFFLCAWGKLKQFDKGAYDFPSIATDE